MRMVGTRATVVDRRIKMAKYLISFTEEDWYNITIEADSLEEAKDKFWSQDYDHEDIRHTGTEIQEDIDVEEV
jgi:hypothetical protein